VSSKGMEGGTPRKKKVPGGGERCRGTTKQPKKIKDAEKKKMIWVLKNLGPGSKSGENSGI